MAARGKKAAKKAAKKAEKKAAKKTMKKAPAKAKAAAKKPAARPTAKKRGVSPIPAGFTTVSPHLVVKNATAAIDFYKKAFGAVEVKRHVMPDSGLVMYAMLKIGDTPVQLADEFPMMEHWKSPESVGGTTVGMHIYVKDVDAAFQRAVSAGATPMFPLTDTFWGDRYGSLRDPFGHVWSLATHKQDLTDEQIMDGAKAFFARMGQEHGGGT